jgi:hypothetical protein
MALPNRHAVVTYSNPFAWLRSAGLAAPLTLAVLAALASPAHASLVLNTGVQIATHAGNLVTDGSFETSAPAPGYANKVYWATGTTNTPFAVPSGWTSSGTPATYALWGSDGPGLGQNGSDTIPDGQAALYFGNYYTTVNQTPTFNANGLVTFPSPPTFSPFWGAPCTLSQVVPTQMTPAPSYVLNFWVSGESAAYRGWATQGVAGLKVTNVLPGDPQLYFAIPNLASNPSLRLEFFFTPLNSSLPVTVEFTNWGHLIDATGVASSELVLDDVIVNAVPEPGSASLLAGLLLLVWRRR